MSLKRIDRTFLGKIKGRANGKGGFFFHEYKMLCTYALFESFKKMVLENGIKEPNRNCKLHF